VTTASRLPAAERRRALVETAIRLFADSSYRGTTTAEIARAAGVSEPILYRHFGSKRELYLAALDHLWEKTRVGKEHVSVRSPKLQLAELWVQALTEAADDPELRRHLRDHLREVHDFLAAMLRRGQVEGVIAAERDADAEAWLLLAGGLLGMVGRRVGLLDDAELAGLREARLSWLKA
jgi:AcrR family transcriptional regulator